MEIRNLASISEREIWRFKGESDRSAESGTGKGTVPKGPGASVLMFRRQCCGKHCLGSLVPKLWS